MGITEEAGGVAKRTIAILSGAPMLLALVLLNLSTCAMVTYLVASAIENRAKEREQMIALIERCLNGNKP